MKYIRENKLKGLFKKGLCGLLAVIMLITAFPLQAIAAKLDYDDLASQKSTYINNVDPVTPAVLDGTKSAEEYIKDPEMPEIYTLYSDYLVKKDNIWKVNYQPYVASVGANATAEEQAKVKKTINLPELKGYEKPQESFDITYKSIVDAAKTGEKTGDTWQKNQEFRYDAKESSFYVKHVFQSLTDFNEYGKKDGESEDHFGLVTGRTGSLLDIQPLDENLIEGFTPEADKLTSMVPENTRGFQVEYRYNRNAYEIDYDTDGGSDLDSRLLYYGQVIPKVKEPTKKGSVFLGWKPSTELKGTVNNVAKTFAANEIIKDGAGNAIKDLDANLIVPAKDLVFTAVWKDAPKADYLIQFWTEKPDYDDKDDTLPLRDRYDYIGSRRIEDADTGLRPNLTNLSIEGITFPDLNDGRLEKAQKNPEEFARYYFLNKDLTDKQNRSKKDPNVQKSVLSTGETVYNVYYNRRVYTLYFTAANEEAFDLIGSFWPIITRNGQVIGKGGAPYKVDVRFNQSLDKIWPKDEEVSNLPPASSEEGVDIGLIGWIINNNAGEQIYRDTPPYRLSAEDFIDSQEVLGTEEFEGFGHSDQIPIGENKTKARDKYEISIGSTSYEKSVVHHIDIIKDDFDGKEQIDYDMSYWKSDTSAGENYAFGLPHLQGFTLKEERREAEGIGLEKGSVGDWTVYKTFDELNAERNKKTPFRSDADKIEYIDKFPWGTKSFNGVNAYNYANYTRNKYKLKVNDDPKNIKNDNEYTDGINRFDVFYEMPLNNLNLDEKYLPKKPAWVPENWEFKGWATDPAGENLLKDGKETKLHYDQFLFAKWGEPDYKWKVTIDPDGGTMKNITVEDLIFRRNEYHNVNKSAVKEANDGNKQIFTVNHREKLNKLQAPKRKGYDFLGWQVIRHNEDGSVDTSYRKEYGVPELYAFGNDVVGEVYIKAIWLANNKIDVPVYHHFIDKDGNEIGKPKKFIIEDARAKYYTAATATEQNQDWILMPHEELMDLPEDNNVKQEYTKYNEHHKFDNTDIHSLKVEPLFILGEDGSSEHNPKAEFNEFHFYYRRFKTRDYKVNYLDKKAQADIEKIIKSTDTDDAKKEAIAKIVKDNSIIPQEEVVSRNRHYDARNYRHIPGWKLASDPQQQLFYDVDEATGEFKGINETGLDEIFFYYEDVRVIDVPKDDPVPDGYVRITFKADKGGAFTDKNGNPKTEIYYDVIKGLKSDLLVVPQELKEGADKEEGKYYITPDKGKTFTKWDEKPLLNENTIIDRRYTFTAYFDWSGLSAKGLVTTEAFIDPNGTWTNDFAPKIEDLKKQLEWKEKDIVKPLPAGTDIKFYDEDGNELKTDEDVFKLVNEKKAADKDELIRTVNIKAKVTFPDKKDPQELDIPVKVYKNVYEALNKAGDKPLFLKEAEGKEAKDGGLKDVTGEYVMVTIKASKDFDAKDDKIYYVNKNAWVEIPEVKTDGSSTFVNWTADKAAQNEGQAETGIFDFGKRHKFTENTVISPSDAKDVVEQTDPNKKPPVPDTFVKVIVKTTDKAADEFTKTFWVNPTKEVAISVTNPTGKEKQKVTLEGLGEKEVNYIFKEWQKVQTGETDDNLTKVDPAEKIDLAKHQYTDKVTVVEAAYKKSIEPEEIEDPLKTTKLDVPQGKTIEDKDLIEKITPQEGKEIDSITIVEKPDPNTPGKQEAKVIVKYKDGSTQGTDQDPVIIPVEVHKNIIPAGPKGEKPEGALDNYVRVIFKAGTGGKLEDTLTGNFI
ncbi:MAG: InlB B-repeat-containing protein, partial [Peptoniphilus senegalensis]